MQYNATLAITGATQTTRTSQTKLYEKVGLETLTSDVGLKDHVPKSKSKHLAYEFVLTYSLRKACSYSFASFLTNHCRTDLL